MGIFNWIKNIINYIITQYYFIVCFFVFVHSQIQDMQKLSRIQGFRLHGTNHVELHSVRVLIVALVQALDALVRVKLMLLFWVNLHALVRVS